MAKFKKIGIVVFAVLMIFGICAMSAGCSDSDKIKELQQQIDKLKEENSSISEKLQILESNDLQQQIAELESKIKKQNGKIADYEDKIKELVDKNSNLKNAFEQYTEIMKDLIDSSTLSGFFTLQQAYYLGFLTVEDLQTISNYHNTPGFAYPGTLSEETAKAIKQDWTKLLEERDKKPVTEVNGETARIVAYYGNYNDCVAVIIERADAMYIDQYAPYTVEIGGVIFSYNIARPQILVWKP